MVRFSRSVGMDREEQRVYNNNIHYDNSYFIQSTWKMFRLGYDSVLLTNPK